MKNFWQQLPKPIFGLAPMDGVTDEPTRQIQCLISKPGVMYTEFISVEGFVKNPKVFDRKTFFQENERPIVVQLFGYTPKCFFETILQLSEKNFDGIDINMGCPATSVVKKGGGGELIGNYLLAEKIINHSLKAIEKTKKKIPLSVKTRIGKEKPITKQWVSFLCNFPLAEITIHGRLLKQGRKGNVNWEETKIASDIIKQQRSDLIILGNGGIKNLKEAKQKVKECNLDGTLIGQAALGNPWIFKESYQPTKEEIIKTIILHCHKVNDFYPKDEFVRVLKHLSWYPKGFPGCVNLKIKLLACKSLEQVINVIQNFEK